MLALALVFIGGILLGLCLGGWQANSHTECHRAALQQYRAGYFQAIRDSLRD